MILFIGLVYFKIIEWVSEKYRVARYSRMLRPCIGRAGSIIVHRLGVPKINPIPVVLPAEHNQPPIEYQRRLDDDYLDIDFVEPKQIVNIETWSAYAAFEEEPVGDVLVLLQAAKHDGKYKPLDIPIEYLTHVFERYYPSAWEPGDPYKVLLRASFKGFVEMVDKFGQGRLTMGEDLDLFSLSTVKVCGKAFTPSTDSHQAFPFHASSGSLSNMEPSGREITTTTNETNEDPEKETKNSSGKVEFYLDPKERDVESKKDNTLKIMQNNKDAINKGVSRIKNIKPPNILVYTDQQNGFLEIRDLLEHCIDHDAYTIYHLKPEQLLTTPWMDNTSLLVLSAENDNSEIFMKYFQNGGNILSFRSSIEKNIIDISESSFQKQTVQFSYKTWKGVRSVSSMLYYKENSLKTPNARSEILAVNDENKEGLIAMVTLDKAKAILVQLYLDQDPLNLAREKSIFETLKESNKSRLEILQDLLGTLDIDCSSGSPPELTPAYLLSSKTEFKKSFTQMFQNEEKSITGKSVTLQLVEDDDTRVIPSVSLLPLCVKSLTSRFEYFNQDKYWKNLTSEYLGRVLIYTDVIPTTMSLFDGFIFSVPDEYGVAAVAGRQTSGRGRGGNSWLSPVGCAMFSVHVRIDKDSELGGKVTFLQHIVSLAVVQSVKSLPGCSDLPLKLKWPNDIYFARSIKLGGVIVNCSMMGKTMHAIIGCGFNVKNSNPTICINDVISQYNKEHGTTLPLCETEQLIARAISNTEKLIHLFQQKGHDAFCELYYENWIHGGERVKVESLDFSVVTVVGLDEFGFLKVKKDSGQIFSLQPDGNSFDIMHNLIAIKRS